jgi:hypothetical protein
MGVRQRRHQGRKQSKKGLLVSCHLTFISYQFGSFRSKQTDRTQFKVFVLKQGLTLFLKLTTDKCQMTTDQ